jgi:2,3-diaminopropionate biosynthesis protein SbnA
MLERVGNTPIQPARLVIDGVARTVYLKLEGRNPSHSSKDRTALAVVEALERRGALTPETVLIESTSGNMGVSLAFVCRAKGYRYEAVVDPKTPVESVEKMRALGAAVRVVDRPDGYGNHLAARLETIRALCAADPRYLWADQYTSPANPYAHYAGTAPEIFRQMDGRTDAVFVAVGTGGTLAGVGRYFREASPATRIVAVDAHGSAAFGGPPGPRRLTGIGSARPSSFVTRELYDTCVYVRDVDAFACCRQLDAQGVRLGGSSGAVVLACARYLREHPGLTRAVCICPDEGDKYLDTIFDDGWLEKQGVDLRTAPPSPVQEIRLSPRVLPPREESFS